jgi:hypothetical protein
MTIALLLMVAGLWLRRASRPLPPPVARPRLVVEIEVWQKPHLKSGGTKAPPQSARGVTHVSD